VNEAERRQLDHGLDLAFEQHRQHDEIPRHDAEQRRADRNGVRRNVRHQPLPLVDGALSTRLAKLQNLLVRLRPVARVGREQPQLRAVSVSTLDEINRDHTSVLQYRRRPLSRWPMTAMRLWADIPPDAVPVSSALLRVVRGISWCCGVFEAQVKAVIELASLSSFTASGR